MTFECRLSLTRIGGKSIELRQRPLAKVLRTTGGDWGRDEGDEQQLHLG